MIPGHRRFIRDIRNLVILTGVLAVLIVVIAALVKISADGTAAPKTYSPAETLSNFPTVAGAVIQGAIGLASQYWIIIFVQMLSFVGIFWYMAKGTTHNLRPGEYHITLNDVRGQPEIVASIRQVMDLFQGHTQFKKHFGGYPPKGLLFEGPPGTGKTLLAKAIAGESGVPFMYASGAGFANMFLGVPQLKMRGLFKKARKFSKRWGGCVVFIDEIDAIGGSRTGVSHARNALERVDKFVVPGSGGGDSMLVNAMLTEMDGIDKPPFFSRTSRRLLHMKPPAPASYNILVIGATNRAQTLDAALLRHGRFDRKVHIGVPGEEGRRDIIAFYLNKVAHVPIDVDKLAKATKGYSPARIKAIINEGLIFAHRAGRGAVSYEDIWQAKLHDEIGLVDPVQYSRQEKMETAIHEAGHAIARQYLDARHSVEIITVKKRGGTLGLVHSQEVEETYSSHKSDMLVDIKVSLAGMVAEELYLGQSTSGPSSDLASATMVAVRMIALYGMGTSLISHSVLDGRIMSDDSVTLALRDPAVRSEVDQILNQCKTETRQFLEEHRKALELTRDALIERDELTGDEFRLMLFQNGQIDQPPATMVPLPVMQAPGYPRAMN